MSGTISFLGMSSDQDMNAYVDAMVSIRRNGHVKPLENWKTTWETKLDTIDTIDSTLASFYSTVRGMDRINEFMVRQAASSDSTVLSVSADSSATIGSYSVEVNQLAGAETETHAGVANDIEYHAGVADKTASINDSGIDKTYKYSYNSSTYTITVNNGDTLENLRDDINAGATGVTASIVTTGGQDHLVLSETAPAGAQSIVVDPDSDMTLDGTDSTTDFTGSTFTETINASGSDKVFQLQYGSNAAFEITVPNGTTLTGLRDMINNANTGIRASILDDGGDGSGANHLVLTGEDTGDDYAIVLNAGGGGTTTLDGTGLTEDFTHAGFTETASAKNTQLKVNGYPAGPPWIERSSTQISDVMEGVSLNLVKTGSATVTVSTDNSAIIEKVVAFTESFNTIRNAIRDATKYDATTDSAGTLLGNYAVQIIKTRLDNIITGTVDGFLDPGDVYSTLQQLGFSTDAEQGSETEGQLLLDTAALTTALNSDPDTVGDLFAAYLDGLTDDTQISFGSSLPTATPGVFDVEVDTDTAKGRFRIQGETWGDWVDLAGSSGNYTLTGADGPEKGVALNISYASGTGVHSTVLQLKSGVAAQLSDELTTLLSTSGPLYTLEENYNDIIDNIEDRISDEERRLTLYEENLRERFTRLDQFISRMNGMSDSIASMANSLMKPSNSKK